MKHRCFDSFIVPGKVYVKHFDIAGFLVVPSENVMKKVRLMTLCLTMFLSVS